MTRGNDQSCDKRAEGGSPPAPVEYAQPGAFWGDPLWFTMLVCFACLLGIGIICVLVYQWVAG